MSWVTPKTNWVDNDYFNYEDAIRIDDNINYLTDTAIEIYQDYDLLNILYPTYVYPYEGHFYYYYALLDINPNHIRRNNRRSDLIKGTTNFSWIFWLWYNALAVLDVLLDNWLLTHPRFINYFEVPTYYRNAGDKGKQPTNYYYGYGFISEAYPPFFKSDPYYFLYDRGGLEPQYYTTTLYTADSHIPYSTYLNYSNDSSYRNTPFWRSAKINAIETKIQRIYTNFTQTLGG
jgi:hypothetical protein